MINDLNETLKQLMINQAGLDQSQISISFAAPSKEWASHQSRPVVDLYLYDIKENHDLRGFDWTVSNDGKGVATKKKAPTRLDLTYAITVWTKEVEDEHSLLGRILITLMKYPVLPPEICCGSLKNSEFPIHVSTAQPDDSMKSITDFWNALGNNLKPLINYIVTIPVDLGIAFSAPLVATRTLEFHQTGREEAEDWVQIGGAVRKKGKAGAVMAGVSVSVKDSGLTAVTDESGNYKLSKIRKGNYIFEVTASGRTAREIEITVPGNTYDIEL
ncbi:MAG: Pvc16 family protein [Chloroflexi bacterium]|nr:Pvc16 family protein [Chloroflexota bacterium]